MSNENNRFRRMIERSQDWFWEFDENANFTYVSPRIKDLLGYEPEELIGLNAFDLMHRDEAERVHKHFDPIAKKFLPFNNLINKNIHKDGHEVVIESSGVPIFDEEGQFCGYQGIDRDITHRMKVKEELRRSKNKLQNILDTSLDWIWEIDLAGRHTYSNHRLLDLLGYLPEEFVGKQYFDFLHSDDLKKVQEILPRLISKKRGWHGWVLRWRHKDGSYRYLESNAKPILNSLNKVVGYSGSDRDITERKRSEELLRESEERFRNIAKMLPEVVFELDLSGNLRFANRKAFELFGYAEEDFERGLNAFDMVVPEERDLARERIRQRLVGEEIGAVEYTALRKDGSTFPVILNAIPLMKGLEPVGILGIMTDITERKSNEMTLLAATQAAEAASQTKDLFLAKMSHEIRSPLTTIVGFGELLEDADLTPEHQKYLAAINASGSALASLIDDILDLSKIQTGRLSIKPKDFSLHKLITDLVATQMQQIEKKNLSINISIDTNVPDLLIGDPLRIQQVLLNLLSNSIKFTEKGDIDIAASVVEDSGLRILLEIAVKDTGVGISADLQEYIFDPFAQILDSRPPNCGGSGLGLTISRSLAGLMGGTIRIESQKGVGSTFYLLVPLQRKKGNLSEMPLPEREPSLWSGPVLNVLLAEDNPVNAHFIKTVLKNMGHEVTVVENGKVALDVLKVNAFDLVFMDIQMPVMNGTDVLGVIREQEKMTGKHLIMIALTAYALIGDKEKYLKMGFDGYLSKPFKTKELVGELVRVAPK